jgi:hypothetical protein
VQDIESQVTSQRVGQLFHNPVSPGQGYWSPQWVKLRRTQCEQMSSELALKADIAQYSRHVSKVPGRDIRFRKSALYSSKLLGAAHARNLQFQPV